MHDVTMVDTAPVARFAVVGAGPSGCYTAQALRKAVPEAEITVFERLPTPFGLVRSGVAADHQGTKAVSLQFARLFERDGVRFAGNVVIGREISLRDLRRHYDVVVLATGLSADVDLDLPGAELPQVFGSGRVTRLLNGHPAEPRPAPILGSSVAVIGHGNVAMDIVRLLAKETEDLADSDIDDDAHARLTSRVRVIHAVGRSAPGSAKFDPAMLREIAELRGVQHTVHRGAEAPAAEDENARDLLVRELEARSVQSNARVHVEWWFGFTPCSITGAGQVEGLLCADARGVVSSVPADSVITAIGFRPEADDLRLTITPQEVESGRISPGLYVAGWRRRGPRGTIPAQRADARALADLIVDELEVVSDRGGWTAIRALVPRATSFADWIRIDAHEVETAPPGRLRRKIANMDEVRRVLALTRAAADPD